jgi:hypothetical protein
MTIRSGVLLNLGRAQDLFHVVSLGLLACVGGRMSLFAINNVEERDVDPSSEDKVVVYELQVEDILEDSKVITILKDTRG